MEHFLYFSFKIDGQSKSIDYFFNFRDFWAFSRFVWSGEYTKIAFPFPGFSASAMWPIIISLALNSFKDHHEAFDGILITGIIGGAIWPLIIGSIGDALGLRIGMLVLYISLGYILGIGIWAKPFVTNKTIWKKRKNLVS